MTLIEEIDLAIENEAQELAVAWLENLRRSIFTALDSIDYRRVTPERTEAGPHLDAILSIMRTAAVEKARKELRQRAVSRMLEDSP